MTFNSFSQHSVARKWNEVLLEAIRDDYARPTVHARNLFHTAIALYDSWAIFEEGTQPYLLGNTIGNFFCEYIPIEAPTDVQKAQEEVMSYAAHRLLRHRFVNSPNPISTKVRFDTLMTGLGYSLEETSIDYQNGSLPALGNYIAECIINFGNQDGANEANEYENEYYSPINPPLIVDSSGNPSIINPNRWQPLTLEQFIDQSGNVTNDDTPDFLSPEWGNVFPFSLSVSDVTVRSRDNNNYNVYMDPGTPPLIGEDSLSEEYKWNFSLVVAWASHLDPADGVLWDISPNSIGNIQQYPNTFEEYQEFYDFFEGGDPGTGYTVNPITGNSYETQIIPRGDYSRILAEFWADGPDSETPPGHWFTILNYVNDHQLLEKRFEGSGAVLNDLEWDVKSYFILGGAMHDCAIAAWSIKGWYDYIRPVSAIRYMTSQGQCSDTTLSNFNKNGIPLVPNFIEVVMQGDPLAGSGNENVGKIKVYSWRGPDYIDEPETDQAGVGWILAENWWPYQRPSFVTPPFAGYVSGHSTYSRAAAEVLSKLTGDTYFPGGIGEFDVVKNEFLVFEEGPSINCKLQWATYKDASDQCSLSRIWGGIHPPVDDIPGRLIGEKIGNRAFEKAKEHFGITTSIYPEKSKRLTIYPNPINKGELLTIQVEGGTQNYKVEIIDVAGKVHHKQLAIPHNNLLTISTKNFVQGINVLKISNDNGLFQEIIIVD